MAVRDDPKLEGVLERAVAQGLRRHRNAPAPRATRAKSMNEVRRDWKNAGARD